MQDEWPVITSQESDTVMLLEEAVGAYGFSKELLGDRKHHVAHLVAEALGAAALIKDIRDRSS